jgi:hypothetical protein
VAAVGAADGLVRGDLVLSLVPCRRPYRRRVVRDLATPSIGGAAHECTHTRQTRSARTRTPAPSFGRRSSPAPGSLRRCWPSTYSRPSKPLTCRFTRTTGLWRQRSDRLHESCARTPRDRRSHWPPCLLRGDEGSAVQWSLRKVAQHVRGTSSGTKSLAWPAGCHGRSLVDHVPCRVSAGNRDLPTVGTEPPPPCSGGGGLSATRGGLRFRGRGRTCTRSCAAFIRRRP